jgi:hypothetical protein
MSLRKHGLVLLKIIGMAVSDPVKGRRDMRADFKIEFSTLGKALNNKVNLPI